MSNTVKYYLAAYNLTALFFWALFIVRFFSSGLNLDAGLPLLNIAQGLAVLEIFHAILKWVKSPIGSTIAQVASRLLVVFVVDAHMCDISLTQSIGVYSYNASLSMAIGILIVSLAWSITEMIRFSFYFLSLFNLQPRWLLWMRYTFFIALYPLGVTGEWLIFISPIIAVGFAFNFYTAFVVLLFVAYAYYFPVLYKYMWKQRKLKL